MENTQNKMPTIDIKGKEYVLVKDRILYFNKNYPNGAIISERLEKEWEMEIFKAKVIPDCDKPERYFTAYSQWKWGEWFINKTSAMENAETSAIWRCLAMMGIWIIDSVASADEMFKAWATAKEPITIDEIFPEEVKKPIFDESAFNWFKTSVATWHFKLNSNSLKDIKNKYEVSKEWEEKINAFIKQK